MSTNNKNERKQELDLDTIKHIELNGLLYFRDYCKKYKYNYFLGFGTLIGAVRHKGFIPWDDDIDIWMPRNDYEDFILNADRFNNEDWKIYSYKTDKDYLYPWVKISCTKTEIYPSRFNTGLIYGISLDVFPLDFIPDSNYEDSVRRQRKLREDYHLLESIIKPSSSMGEGFSGKMKKRIKRIYYNLIGKRRKNLVNEYIKIENEMNTKSTLNCRYLGTAFSTYDTVWDYDWFFPCNRELQFEGELFSVPFDYDSLLRKIYGDYLKLPPESERRPHHKYKAFFV